MASSLHSSNVVSLISSPSLGISIIFSVSKISEEGFLEDTCSLNGVDTLSSYSFLLWIPPPPKNLGSLLSDETGEVFSLRIPSSASTILDVVSTSITTEKLTSSFLSNSVNFFIRLVENMFSVPGFYLAFCIFLLISCLFYILASNLRSIAFQIISLFLPSKA